MLPNYTVEENIKLQVLPTLNLVLELCMIKALSILYFLGLGMMAVPSSPPSTVIILLVILFLCSIF